MNINLHKALLSTLSYFDFFRYPINNNELLQFLPVKSTEQEISEAMSFLLARDIVQSYEGYYGINCNKELVERRIQGNIYAQKRLKKAKAIANFLGNFPFVDAVCISGSLSKNFSTKDGDLDFFIITAKNRLWIARSLMHLFKKLTFVAGAQHSFCMNYYLSSESLSVQPQNVFTAIEIATLKPAFIKKGLKDLHDTNCNWVKEHLPNVVFNKNSNDGQHNKWLPTRLFEQLIDLKGDSINRSMFNFTKRKWISKWQRKGYDVNTCLKCMDIHYNTPLNVPRNLPDIILQKHQSLLNSILEKYEQEIAYAVPA